jgi:hypothetical protein
LTRAGGELAAPGEPRLERPRQIGRQDIEQQFAEALGLLDRREADGAVGVHRRNLSVVGRGAIAA